MSTHNLCFGAKIRKTRFTPAYPNFTIKVGYKGVFISRTCFPDGKSENGLSGSVRYKTGFRRYSILSMSMIQ